MYFFSKRITLENREEIEQFANAFPHETSGLTFTSLYMWRNQNHFSYEIINDFMCIAGYSNFEGFKDEPFVFPLLSRTRVCDKKMLKATMEEVIRIFEEYGYPFIMRLVPPHMRNIYNDLLLGWLLTLNVRPNHDYVYMVDELAELKG